MISAWWLLLTFIAGVVIGCMLEALAVAAARRDKCMREENTWRKDES